MRVSAALRPALCGYDLGTSRSSGERLTNKQSEVEQSLTLCVNRLNYSHASTQAMLQVPITVTFCSSSCYCELFCWCRFDARKGECG